ncbi:MAG: hypothetical protein WKF85_06920 [Chitinophagaceae bacterium]
MKKVLMFVPCVFTTILLFLSCSKDQPTPVQPPTPVIPPPVAVNQPPVARAGADVTFTLSSCGTIISFPLDGTKSSDPENKITGASWNIISGPRDIILVNPGNLYAGGRIFRAGVYNIELKIVDNGNLTSKDTVTITVIGSSPKEYDLDITSNTTYRFSDNVEVCDGFGFVCSYRDVTFFFGTGTFVPIGVMNISINEETDTAAFKYGTSNLSVFQSNSTTASLFGTTSINFKKLIQQGGGAFTGNFNTTDGSAKYCDENIYNSLAPLLVTGSLDTATKKISIRIKGKTFF